MPKLEPKQVQKELEAGSLWPVYWLYGHERMKSRELFKRIRKAVLGDDAAAGGLGSLAEESLDGSEVTAGAVVDAARSLSLGGGLKLVVVRDAHAIKEADEMACLLGPPANREALSSVCVFFSKDLDGRKKFSKMLTERAAVVPCEDVAEGERDAWIGYLSRRKGVALTADETVMLRLLDPWSLDIVEQELEKYALAKDSGENAAEVLLSDGGRSADTEAFVQGFFSRNARQALEAVAGFADRPEESLPLLGLLGWHVRQLAALAAAGPGQDAARGLRLPPHLVDRFRSWGRSWRLEDVIALQDALSEIDFSVKQTPRIPVGLWSALVLRFCQ